MDAMRAVEIIDRKRLGLELDPQEIGWIVRGHLAGEVPDYQMAAWLMAVCCRGMTPGECSVLTTIMRDSGTTLDLSRVPWPVADKHSSGGVGDKTTLVVAPIVRACGVAVGKMSGRGLGFTGGTVDKLESVPGYRAELSAAEFMSQLERIGIVVSGQSVELAPADGRLYALRDVTGTVQSIPLIASSIMSKKLAVGAGALVLDVKYGVGAFMPTRDEARELARMMVDVGLAAGKRVSAMLSPMEQPLGRAVGNALEVEEAIATLLGRGPEDLVTLCVGLAGEMVYLAGQAESPERGAATASQALESGQAANWFAKLLEAQGGDARVMDDPSLMGRAGLVVAVPSPRPGWVEGLNARAVAEASLLLGAGRQKKGDAIDPAVGIVLQAKLGDRVEQGAALAEIHAPDASSAELARARLLQGYRLTDNRPAPAGERVERFGGS